MIELTPRQLEAEAARLLREAEAALATGDRPEAARLVALSRRKMTWRTAVHLGGRAAAVENATRIR